MANQHIPYIEKHTFLAFGISDTKGSPLQPQAESYISSDLHRVYKFRSDREGEQVSRALSTVVGVCQVGKKTVEKNIETRQNTGVK